VGSCAGETRRGGAAEGLTGRTVTVLARIGRFEVERTLGSGSFATVWLARDEDLEAWVAIKLLAENWSFNEDARRRFLQEARALRKLDDDRIVRVYEVGRLPDDRPYMVMEYADRGSLEERMRLRAQLDQPYSVREAVALSVDLADCLASVHASRIVHRDVKPSNVLFKSIRTPRRDAEGRIAGTVAGERTLLGDFGIARSLEGILGPTRIVGSPQYMAPEQADAELAGHVDERADLYSAAVILYELLAGRPPRPVAGEGSVAGLGPQAGVGSVAGEGSESGGVGSVAGGASRGRHREPAPIGGLRRDVPDALAEVIHRGLAADRRERFASAERWREALLRAVDAEDGPLPGVVVDDDPPRFARVGGPTSRPSPSSAPTVPTLPVPAEPTLPAGPGRPDVVRPVRPDRGNPTWPDMGGPPRPDTGGPTRPVSPVPAAASTAAASTERRTMVMEEDDPQPRQPPAGRPEAASRREVAPPTPVLQSPPPRADAASYPAQAPLPAAPVAAPRPVAVGATAPAAQPVPMQAAPIPGPIPGAAPAAGPGLGDGFRRARLPGAVVLLAGAIALAAAFVPFGRDQAGAGLEARLASSSVTLDQAAALGGLFLVLAGWAIRRTTQRWAGRLLAVPVWLAGAAALVTGAIAGLSSALDAGRGPTLAPFVLSAAGLVAVVGAQLALRRFRRPFPSLPPIPPPQPVRPA
jgi:serine/threonine protein kinase